MAATLTAVSSAGGSLPFCRSLKSQCCDCAIRFSTADHRRMARMLHVMVCGIAVEATQATLRDPMALTHSLRKHDSDPAVLVLDCDGGIDTTSSQEFSTLIDDILKRHACPLLLDLSDISYVSSAGWCVLVSRAKDIMSRRIDLRIVGMQPAVRDIYEMIGLATIISAHATVEDAVAAIRETNGSAHADNEPAS